MFGVMVKVKRWCWLIFRSAVISFIDIIYIYSFAFYFNKCVISLRVRLFFFFSVSIALRKLRLLFHRDLISTLEFKNFLHSTKSSTFPGHLCKCTSSLRKRNNFLKRERFTSRNIKDRFLATLILLIGSFIFCKIISQKRTGITCIN